MRRFLRWLLGVPEAVSIDFLHGVDQRLSDVEDGQAHMDRRFVRLQQQVTRWSRDVEDEDEIDEEDAVLDMIERRKRGEA